MSLSKGQMTTEGKTRLYRSRCVWIKCPESWHESGMDRSQTSHESNAITIKSRQQSITVNNEVTGNSKSQLDLNHDWITHVHLICPEQIWFIYSIWFDLDLNLSWFEISALLYGWVLYKTGHGSISNILATFVLRASDGLHTYVSEPNIWQFWSSAILLKLHWDLI